MIGPTALNADFADGNVPLGLMVGAIGALSVVERLLPDATETRQAHLDDVIESSSMEPFVALLLGVVATHSRLTQLVDRSYDPASEHPRDGAVVTVDSLVGIAR